MSESPQRVERVFGSPTSHLAPLLPLTLIVGLRAITDGGILPLSVGPITANVLLGLASIAYGGYLLLRRRRGLRVFVSIAAFAAIWAAIGTPEFGLTPWLEWVRFVSVLAIAAAVLNLRAVVDHSAAALAVQVVCLVPAIVAALQLATGGGIDIQGDIRSAGTLAHPNTAGLLFAVGLLCSVARYAELRRIWDVVVGILLLIALVGTESLGSFAAVLLMVLTFVFISPTFSSRFRLVTLASAIVLPVIVVLSPIGADRLAGLFHTPGDRGSAVESLSWRFETWARLWGTFLESPWIGRGLGATTDGTIVQNNLPHNEYLRALVELGGIGTLITLLGCAVGIWILVRISREPASSVRGAVALALVAGLAINALVANTVIYTVPMFAAALLLGGCITPLGSQRVPVR